MTSPDAGHDAVATFYGAYDQVGLPRTIRQHVPVTALAVGVAAIALVALVGADVATLASPPVDVHVTVVHWYAGSVPIANSTGFSLRAGAATEFPVVCRSFCVAWQSAEVSAPFTLVSFATYSGAVQYTNVTVRAPSSAYDGPLTITLELYPGTPLN